MRVVIVALAVVTAGVAFAASLRQSATFDEIILVSGGVRAVEEGRWDMVTDQPPLMMWLYGWSARTARPALPPEDRSWSFDDRWDYARRLLFESGNDPQALLTRARAVTAVLAGVLVAVAGGLGWWIAGPWAGVLAAALTATLPDVLAHGGVAYNDLPLACAFLIAVWAIDAAARAPSPRRGGLAGVAVAAALSVKLSALALLPAAVLVVAAEAWTRRGTFDWRRSVAVATVAGVGTAYLTLVVLYQGDLALTAFRFNFWRAVLHSTGGHPAPAYLLGATSAEGWWYYFPVAGLFKTPAAFHALGIVALAGLVSAWPGRADGPSALIAWRGRATLLALLVFGAFLLRSNLNAGFRYALPALPLVAILVAVGLDRFVRRVAPRFRRAARTSILTLVVLQALSVLSFHPHFLAYTSLWAGGRDRGWRVLSDSNVDWGQGLLELRTFMQEEGVDRVRLSYFGSARPEAYGIDYVALPSFFRLPGNGVGAEGGGGVGAGAEGASTQPRFTVISATNLVGLYLQGRDPFAAYRDRTPYRVLGHSIFVYDDG